jgi:hypothetical protein
MPAGQTARLHAGRQTLRLDAGRLDAGRLDAGRQTVRLDAGRLDAGRQTVRLGAGWQTVPLECWLADRVPNRPLAV